MTAGTAFYYFSVYAFFAVAILIYFKGKFESLVENIGFYRSFELIGNPGAELKGAETDAQFVKMVNNARATYFVYFFVVGPILILLIHFVGLKFL